MCHRDQKQLRTLKNYTIISNEITWKTLNHDEGLKDPLPNLHGTQGIHLEGIRISIDG